MEFLAFDLMLKWVGFVYSTAGRRFWYSLNWQRFFSQIVYHTFLSWQVFLLSPIGFCLRDYCIYGCCLCIHEFINICLSGEDYRILFKDLYYFIIPDFIYSFNFFCCCLFFSGVLWSIRGLFVGRQWRLSVLNSVFV